LTLARNWTCPRFALLKELLIVRTDLTDPTERWNRLGHGSQVEALVVL